jgi:hypothetical protein
MKIEFKEMLLRALNEGINIFLGAGFSVYAKDKRGQNLPIGSVLCNELVKEFNAPKINDLTKICTIIDSYDSGGLRKYLLSRYDVSEFDKEYRNILRVNSPRIFTTNIDNLVNKIFSESKQKYINNIFVNGFCFNDKNCVDYIPIHGSIEVPDSKFLFNKQDVSGSYRTQNAAWHSLTQAANQLPSIFIGYSLEDVGAIESLFSASLPSVPQKDKWILLHKDDTGLEAYFKALGFRLIVGDVRDFLKFLSEIPETFEENESSEKDYIEQIYPDSRVPKDNYKGRVRQIDEFFLGSAPIWSDVLSNRIYSTSHLDKLINLAESEKNLIVTGIPASGKSTLMLQMARKLSLNKRRVLLFENLSVSKSSIIKNEIKRPTIILIDNFTSDVGAFITLTGNKHIKVVGFDRYYNVDISSHKFSDDLFNWHDVSDLTPQDIQGIYNSIPVTIRLPELVRKRSSDEKPSLFEIVNYNIRKPELNERYKQVLSELEESDPLLLDLLIMTCYMHSCRAPVSFEVANAFLSDDVDSYDDVIRMMDSLKGMVQEVLGDLVDEYDQDQDYYQPRSQVLSEAIIVQTNERVFRSVYERFHEYVPRHVIPSFQVFKRNAFDASYTVKAFSNWREGLAFYQDIFTVDKSPFLLQQCALYLLRKRIYSEAALKIDHALQISHKRFFSIENSHAIILFKANIDSAGSDPKVRGTLDKSMNILQDCYRQDQRKSYHARTFAEQALEYYGAFPDEKAIEYLKLAAKWLKEDNAEKKYYYKSGNLLKSIERVL